MAEPWDGVPANPERDGWHFLHDHEDGRDYPFKWEAEFKTWVGQDIIDRGTWSYIAPCLMPAEVAAREAAARHAGIEEALKEAESVIGLGPDPEFVAKRPDEGREMLLEHEARGLAAARIRALLVEKRNA